MDFKDKIANRFNIIMIVIIFMISVLSIRLAIMTIVEGDHYRDLSDNKVIKDVYKAPIRGEIKDTNGKLLAGNKPSFTVQMLKDETNKLGREEKNEMFLNLVRLLEEDGAPYIDDFPIELNVLKYKNEEDYAEELYKPMDKVIDIIVENGLLNDVLNLYYTDDSYKGHFQYIILNRAISALKDKGIDVPVLTDIKNGILEVEFNEDKDIESFKKEYSLSKGDTPISSVLKLIEDDKAIIRKIVDHSISRKLVYDLLQSKGVDDNLILDDYSILFEEEYMSQKRELMKIFPEVTNNSSAEDDFINIFYNTSIKNFLESSFKKETSRKKEELIYPGKVLLDFLKRKN